MGASYSFTAEWVVDVPPAVVQPVLLDLEHYPEWWPQVVAVASVDEDTARVVCRSRLPYALDLVLTAVHREPGLLEVAVEGDLRGEVRWRLTPAGEGTRLEFEQDVEVAGRLLSLASPLLRPVLRWNHEQMMRGCRRGLRRRVVSRG